MVRLLFVEDAVERPLRLNFQTSTEPIARLEDERGWQNLLKSRKKEERAEAEIAEGWETLAAREGDRRIEVGQGINHRENALLRLAGKLGAEDHHLAFLEVDVDASL